MNVLFLTHARLDKLVYGDASTRYRCFNLAEVLQDSHHQATIQSFADCSLSTIQRYDIVSCLRPIHSRKLQQLSTLCRVHGIHLIADFDDLIFDPDMADQSPRVINGFAPVSQVRSLFTKHAMAIPLFDELTVSTPALSQAISRKHSQTRVNIIRNGLSAYWLQHASRARQQTPNDMRLTYLPGSRSHDQDLKMISAALSRCLKQHPEARLSLVGKIDSTDSDLPQIQVDTTAWVDYFTLPDLIAQCSASLAPLVATPFNYAKSHIKFIESAALGVPSVCSPTSDLIEHDAPGLSLVHNQDDWEQALAEVLCPDYRRTHRQSLIDYALEGCTAHHYCQDTFSAWDSDEYWSDAAATRVA